MKAYTHIFSFFALLVSFFATAQKPLFKRVLVSDVGINNNIGDANTSRNVAIAENGDIYAVFVGSEGVRVSKSINRGQSFLPSIQISDTEYTEPEIAINSEGIIFVSWAKSSNIFFSRSTNNGNTFSKPLNLGEADTGTNSLHMSTYKSNVYIRDVSGPNLFINTNNGIGSFSKKVIPLSNSSDVFADVRTDINGVIHLPSDDPTLYLFNSNNQGNTTQEVRLSPRGSVLYSSYALSDSPSGTFIFVAGNDQFGFKIDAKTGISTPIAYKPNNLNPKGRTLFADNFGALVDGYQDDDGNIKMSISYNQGDTFDLDIDIDDAYSHNIDRNPLTDDLNVIYERKGQVYMSVYDGLLRSVKIIEPNETLALCQEENGTVNFKLSGAFLNNSEFILYLSDQNGNFENKTEIGFVNSTTDGSISFKIPQTIASSKDYRLQIQSPKNFLQSNIIPIHIGDVIEIETIEDVKKCDTGNGTATFNLSDINKEVQKNNDGASTSYFETKNDAVLNTNPIINLTNYNTISKTIWVRLDSNPSKKCSTFNTSPINLVVMPLPNINLNIEDLKKCNNITSNVKTDGFATFNLKLKEKDILNGATNTDFNVTYFTDKERLNKIINPNNFNNTVKNSQTIFVTVSRINGAKCAINTTFKLVVISPPETINNNVILKQCDDNTDGISIFNLNEAKALLSNNFEEETFKFYTSIALAESGVNNTEIANPQAYLNPEASNSTVYVKIINKANCFIITPLKLQVGVSNIPQSFFNALKISNCDDGETEDEYTDGITTFNIENIKNDIDNYFGSLNVNTTFYETQENALSELNSIKNISSYRNSTPKKQTLYVRVDGAINNDCVGFGHFDINVNTLPLKKSISNLIACGTTTATFDLTSNEVEEITNGQPNILVYYYESIIDRDNNTPIKNLTNYISNPKTIYVSTLNTNTGCVNTDMQFELLLDQITLTKPNALKKCSFTINNTFNLTEIENEMTKLNDNLTFEYFKNNLDLLANNTIKNPENYLSESLNSTIMVRATNNNKCTAVTSVNLITDNINVNTNIAPLESCDVDNDGFEMFNLISIENEIFKNNTTSISNFTLKYYLNITDAQNNNTKIIQDKVAFKNILKNKQSIYLRLEHNSGGCYKIIPFEIKTIPTPIIDMPSLYVLCYDNNNQLVISPQQTKLPQVPLNTNLSKDYFSFKWFKGTEISENSLIKLATNSSYTPSNSGKYTVEVTDKINPLACKTYATLEVVNAFAPEKITISQVTNQFSNKNTIDILVEGNGTYQYSDDNINWQNNNRFYNVNNGESNFYVRDIYNCEITEEQVVIVNYPKFFTPNNDGFNDTWTIKGSSKIQITSIQIFDRYGKLVKQIISNTDAWDGTFNGKQLATDDYWFLVNYVNASSSIKKQFKASFTLKR